MLKKQALSPNKDLSYNGSTNDQNVPGKIGEVSPAGCSHREVAQRYIKSAPIESVILLAKSKQQC